MNFDIDIAIVVGFLVLNLCVGLYYGRGINSVREYSVGNQKFSTSAITSTLVATWISGSAFSVIISKTYSDGLYYVIPSAGIIVSFLIIGYIIAPRVGKFLGYTSVANALGSIYGDKVRVITAIAGFVGTIGLIAVQFKVASSLFQHFLGISHFNSLMLASSIVIFYAAFGGIKSVTFTDIMQLFTFVVFIPVMGHIIWQSGNNPVGIFESISQNALFDYNSILDYKNPRFFEISLLFLYFCIPKTAPALFQRISMANSTTQVRNSFVNAALILLCVELLIIWIGVLLLTNHPYLEPSGLLSFLIDNYSYIGLKGFIIAGVMAMVMSTADSHINSSSILLTEVVQSFRHMNTKLELLVTRIFAILLGVLSIGLAFLEKDLFSIILTANSFYMPIVTVPLLMTILGFRSSSKAVLIGILAGFITVMSSFIFNYQFNIIIPAMLVNLLFWLGSHYILEQQVNPPNYTNNEESGEVKFLDVRKSSQGIYDIKQFSISSFFKNSIPKMESTYFFTGIFCIALTYSAMYTIDIELRDRYAHLYEVINYSTLVISGMFITHSVWPTSFKNSVWVSILWFAGLFYILIFVGCLHVILSAFSHFQLMIFIIGMVILSLLVRWQICLLFIITGVIASIEFSKWYVGISSINEDFQNIQFKIIYLLLFMSAIFIAFLKPKQEHLEETEAKVDTLETEVTHLHEKAVHYSERISDQEKEIERLGATAQKILNNVNHELRLPVGNVMNFAEMLGEGLGKFNEDQLKTLSDEVYKNSNRLSSMIMNMLDLATLNAKKLELDKKMINLGELVEDRVNNCRKIYLEDKKVDFELKIHSEIFVSVDPNYMRQVVDNLVINAIKFSSDGLISVQLLKNKGKIEFTIKDNGIGIPKEELYEIFTPFKMGSNTESKAEGRGVGLALCKAAIEAHGGNIIVESDGINGAQFRFVL